LDSFHPPSDQNDYINSAVYSRPFLDGRFCCC